MADIAAAERASLAPVDWGLLFIYFVGVAVAGLICFQWEQRAAGAAGSSGQGGQDQFFLAGRSMSWLPIGLSLFVSNIGSEHLLGLSGSAAADGLAVGIYELTASLDVLVLGWVFAPIYLRSGIATLPEYLERRYSRELRSAFSVVTLLICASSFAPPLPLRRRLQPCRSLHLSAPRSSCAPPPPTPAPTL